MAKEQTRLEERDVNIKNDKLMLTSKKTKKAKKQVKRRSKRLLLKGPTFNFNAANEVELDTLVFLEDLAKQRKRNPFIIESLNLNKRLHEAQDFDLLVRTHPWIMQVIDDIVSKAVDDALANRELKDSAVVQQFSDIMAGVAKDMLKGMSVVSDASYARAVPDMGDVQLNDGERVTTDEGRDAFRDSLAGAFDDDDDDDLWGD